MYDSKSKPTALKKPLVSRDAAVTILTRGCHFTGKLYCKGSSRIDGRIEGELISEGLLIVEENAVINANITADEVVIQGTVKGKLKAKNRVELATTARFDGDITTPSLIIIEGAQFNGRSQMISSKEQSGAKIIEPAGGFSQGSNVTELRPDPDTFGSEDMPEIAAMKLSDPVIAP